MRILKSCLVALAGLVVLAVGAYLVTNVVYEVRADQLRGELSDEVTGRLAQELPAAREREVRLSSQAGRAPDHAWIEQVCERGTNDAGWMVQSYRETCSLRVAGLWRVESRAEALALSRVQSTYPHTGSEGCQLLSSSTDDIQAYFVVVGAQEPYCLREPRVGKRGLQGERVVPGEGSWLYLRHDTPLIDETIGCAHWSVIFCDDPFGESHAFGAPPQE